MQHFRVGLSVCYCLSVCMSGKNDQKSLNESAPVWDQKQSDWLLGEKRKKKTD